MKRGSHMAPLKHSLYVFVVQLWTEVTNIRNARMLHLFVTYRKEHSVYFIHSPSPSKC